MLGSDSDGPDITKPDPIKDPKVKLELDLPDS